MPKTISSLPTGAINRTDNLITATSGSDELKRNTVDELLAEPTADISALQTENAELKEKIAEMEEEISELNTNLIVVESVEQEITIEGGGDYTTVFSVAKDGYTPIGIVGWNTTSVNLTLVRARISGNNVSWWVNSAFSSTQTRSIVLDILYRKKA